MDHDQVWFLRFEEMKSPSFAQLDRKFADLVSAGLSQTTIKKLLDLAPDTKHQFWIHSPSMTAAVQLLNDKSIYATWCIYCETDPIVEIIVRPEEDQSPNTSRCPSSQASLAQRRKDYLLGWIRAELENGKSPDDIWVTSLTPRNRPIENRLTQDVWTRSLIRGPWKDEFLPLWMEAIENQVAGTDKLAELFTLFPSV
ncbi:hypothetical protein EMPG_16802 [Blastomyces silverae]|uniref:Uncharacterized protein n=1 Tax=Blastomyces silverae TaxID=2060906 RepID=A0A0H1B9M8_9EURO|nr:hypothetical protein EMPG_16802 [Blastomyces silverae]